MELTAFSQNTEVRSKSSTFNASSFTLSYFFIATSLMNYRRLFSIAYRTSSLGEILNMFIPDRVCTAIVGMNCNVLCAFV